MLHVVGEGGRGLWDGSPQTAQFANPQGIAVDGDVAYVADTDNHAIRRIDLRLGTVSTLAGNGTQSYDRQGGGKGTEQGLSSPWDLVVHRGKLYIAMAGTHQVWTLDLATEVAEAWVGSGVDARWRKDTVPVFEVFVEQHPPDLDDGLGNVVLGLGGHVWHGQRIGFAVHLF